MAKNDTLNVSYMRKDSQFLADGTWYVTTPCVKCGVVDEEVSWEQAKTPHHAGLIADQRHAACGAEADVEAKRLFGLAEIDAARREVERADALLAAAQQEADQVAHEDTDDPHEKRVAQAHRNVERYRRGPETARRRLKATEAANKP